MFDVESFQSPQTSTEGIPEVPAYTSQFPMHVLNILVVFVAGAYTVVFLGRPLVQWCDGGCKCPAKGTGTCHGQMFMYMCIIITVFQWFEYIHVCTSRLLKMMRDYFEK